MHGFAVFLGKELTEIVRTWRLYVVPGILIFFGLTSPLIAEVTPALVSSMAGSEAQGIVIEIPPATTADAYLQFNNNAIEIAVIALIIATAGAISGERRSGTAQLVLTKPVSRTAMVVAKAVSNWILLAVAGGVGAALCAGVTAIMFDTSLLAEFAAMVGVWYVLAAFLVALMMLFSVLLKSQAGAAGAGIAVFFAMSILSIWHVARDYSPAGLIGLGDRIVLGQPDLSIAWPVATSITATVVLVALAALVFQRREL
ncbi:MAG: ABC transporter permease subunit [Actinobacteria bacterium]|nr:ABC transporter permease subunit [Actinomycetota bacterium]